MNFVKILLVCNPQHCKRTPENWIFRLSATNRIGKSESRESMGNFLYFRNQELIQGHFLYTQRENYSQVADYHCHHSMHPSCSFTPLGMIIPCNQNGQKNAIKLTIQKKFLINFSQSHWFSNSFSHFDHTMEKLLYNFSLWKMQFYHPLETLEITQLLKEVTFF